MTTGRPARKRLRWPRGGGLWPVGLVVVGWLVLSAWRPWVSVPDPTWEGARISIWFRRLVWASEGRWDDHVAGRYLEAKLALLRAGTNAVPCLVTRAMAPERDSGFRRAARALFKARFSTPGRAGEEALALLELLHPRWDQVWPWVKDFTDQGEEGRARSLRVLARTRRNADQEDMLVRELLDPRGLGETATEDLLRHLGEVPSSRIKEATAAVSRARTQAAALGVLSRMGAAGGEAIPALERLLMDVDELTRIRAALVLLEVSGSHAAASKVVSRWGATPSFSAWNGVTNPTTATLCGDAGQFLRITSTESLAAFERWAVAEVDGWEKRGLEEKASTALARVAPARAVALYAAQLAMETNRTNVRIVAAGGWLRLQRTNEVPFRFLVGRIEARDVLCRMAAEALKEADEDRVPGGSRVRELATSATELGARTALQNSRREMAIRRLVERARTAEPP